MRRPRVLRSICLAAALSLPGLQAQASSIALVIAIDVSGSVDTTEFNAQRDAYVNFFNNRAADFAGQNDLVAVLYWAGEGVQNVAIDWTPINSANEATGFAAQLAAVARPIGTAPLAGQTGVAQALIAATNLFLNPSTPLTGYSRVIDISGDGSENLDQTLGWDVSLTLSAGTFIANLPWDDVLDPAIGARAGALAAGILINALPIIPTGTTGVEGFDSAPAGAKLFGASPPLGFGITQAEWDAALIAEFGSLSTTMLEYFYGQVIGSPDSRTPFMLIANGFSSTELNDKIGQKLTAELQLVPEASVLALLVVSSVALALRRRRL